MINNRTCKNGAVHCCWLHLTVQRAGIEDCVARKQTLTNSYQLDHYNKSVHKDACTQQYKHNTYSISSPCFFEQKIARFFKQSPPGYPNNRVQTEIGQNQVDQMFFPSNIYCKGPLTTCSASAFISIHFL